MYYLTHKSGEFWEIKPAGNSYSIVYGKIGTEGTKLVNTCVSEQACINEVFRLIGAKVEAGYALTLCQTKNETARYFVKRERESSTFWTIEFYGDDMIRVNTSQKYCIGKSELLLYESKDVCHEQFHQLIEEKLDDGFIETIKNPTPQSELPGDLITGLLNQWSVDIPDGSFSSLALQDVRQIAVGVSHQAEEGSYDSAAPADKQPRSKYPKTPYDDQEGLFFTEGYGLVYSPDYDNSWGILVWLPKLNMYGTWDSVHYELIVFPNITWKDIQKDPGWFIGQQWSGNENFPFVQGHINVWNYFDFIPSNLYQVANEILKLPEEKRNKRAEQFIVDWEDRLLQIPYDIGHPAELLSRLYEQLGTSLQSKGDYAKALQYFQKELCIESVNNLNQRSKVLLNLGFSFQKISAFDKAIQYLNAYILENPGSWFAWHYIALIHHKQNRIDDAIGTYKHSIELGSKEPYTFNNLAICYSKKGKVEAAIELTLKAREMAPKDSIPAYNLACYHAAQKSTTQALHYLEEALQKGYRNTTSLMEDKELVNVRETPQFKTLLVKYKIT